ncbi:MAG: hypothetical protein KF726_25000 [Anaerolineae bacterium]|nr:hypothetical protein [Anaerolineae bacterium]
MFKSLFAALLIVSLLISGSGNAQAAESAVAITLERTACFRTCPIYTVTIYEDGTVIYHGENFVTVTGEQTSSIDPETVKLMVAAFEEAGYFGWNEAYDTRTVSDLPTVITSVTVNGQQHRIARYAGDSSAPLALPFLEQWIDLMAQTAQWTGAQFDFTAISVGEQSPVVTLQRGPCFGACPIYNVAAFEDGTVVYVGIANVTKIGVVVLQTDAATIELIAQMAQASGYFKWEDAYQYMTITDQSTVITSVRWQDQYKTIIRYEGDLNAPIGLARVEQSIEALVTTLVG